MSTDPLIGRQFGSYELKDLLGRGGMAAVYRGYQASIDRSVAVKVLPSDLLADPHFSTRFANEARTLAKLTHPSILPLYDFGEAHGMPFIVMPLMSNGTLADRLKGGPLPLAETVRVIMAVAQALDFANRQGILHRDIKPNNILFDQHDNPYLADFGIAKATESSTSLTGTGIIGTPDYMSPEQARGDVLDARSDQYSLGVVAYQCLTGATLFRATTPMGVIFKHVTEAPRSLRELVTGVPAAVDQVVLKALAKSPEERYASAAEFARALAQAAGQTPAAAPAGPTAVHDEPATQLHPPAGAASAFSLPPESAAPPASGGWASAPGPAASPASGGFSLPADALAGTPLPAEPKRGLNPWLIGGGVAALLFVCCGALFGAYLFFGGDGGGPGGETPAPADTATPEAANVLFEENFTNAGDRWNTFDDGAVSREMAGGAYVFRSSNTKWFTWDNPDRSFTDVRIEVTARNTGADDVTFGLMCHYQDNENYYSAGIGADGYYAIIRTEGNKDFFLTDATNNQWKQTDLFPQFADSYRLALECANGDLALYVDEVLVAEVQDEAFAQGDIGLFLLTFDKPNGEVRFDDLVVTSP